jgi:hypothetical protein
LPNPFISQSERDIRQAVVQRARQLWPDARIIHELNVEHGQCRADVAAVTSDTIVLFEIKSERDTLSRLSNQLRHFQPVCHGIIVAAHERWCSGSKYPNCDIDPILRHARCGDLWRYPEPEAKWGIRAWREPITTCRPWPHRMLRLLWTEELQALASLRGLKAKRTAGYKLADELALLLTGQQVEKAVCSALRARPFAEADDPILDASHAA